MTVGGWIALILAVGGVSAWTVWCFCKVFTTPDASHLSAEPTIDPPDARETREEDEDDA